MSLERVIFAEAGTFPLFDFVILTSLMMNPVLVLVSVTSSFLTYFI